MAQDDSSMQISAPHDERVGRKIRSHQKSRRGCLACKGRKIKCCETRPACTNCKKNDLQCAYPEAQIMAFLRVGRVQCQPRGFSLRDMRFFHDYLTASYPHLPLSCENAWIVDIPILAQQHEFLMHAILALGASHLNSETNLELEPTVQRYRAMAMNGLIDAHSDGSSKNPDAKSHESLLNAKLACAYALTFTTTYMGEPLSEFLVLARGCAAFADEIMKRGYSSPLFYEGQWISSEGHIRVMAQRLKDAPGVLDLDQIATARNSLLFCAANCSFIPVERKVLEKLLAVLDNMDVPSTAYRHLVELWEIFTTINGNDFAHFKSPTNVAGIVLQAHFLASECILRPWLLRELPPGRLDRCHSIQTFRSLPKLEVPEPLAEQLMAWPTSMIMATGDEDKIRTAIRMPLHPSLRYPMSSLAKNFPDRSVPQMFVGAERR